MAPFFSYIHPIAAGPTAASLRRHVCHSLPEGGGAAPLQPLVVVGSINADLVLPVDRLPAVGETLAASRLDTFPGGKVGGVLCSGLGSAA